MKKPVNAVAYPLLPLRGMLVFPHMVIPFEVARERSIQALDQAMIKDKLLVMAAQREREVDEPQAEDLYTVGTLGRVKQVLKMPEGHTRVLVEGLSRVQLTSIDETGTHLETFIEELGIAPETDLEIQALMRLVSDAFSRYVHSGKKIPGEVLGSIAEIEEPERLADTIAGQLTIKLVEKQELLEETAVKQRLERILAILNRETGIQELEKKIRLRVKQQIEKNQREFYLREQMKAIQKELGERDEKAAEVEAYQKKIEAARLPKAAKERAYHELRRLERMPAMAAELVVVRSYLDWLLALPWTKRSRDRISLDAAEEVLEGDHYGLQKVKTRILEFLAVRKLAKGTKGPILCFVGPPGVGKTSLGRSIASALKRSFVRLSLGGVRDEAEIRGHRRTYVGALPGKILQALKTAGTRNPVMLLDEVDKLAADFRGDPAAALLEVLDPEQNHCFSDHYLELPFDLSDILFITTANVAHGIPDALRDRLEVIHIAGYTEDEKFQIGKQHLLPKQIEAHGLKPEQLYLSDNLFRRVINDYTREAGVRNLERQLAAICRKAAAEIVKGRPTPVRVTAAHAARYLGTPKYRHHQVEDEDRIGVATGLAYTQHGGEILSIEVTVVEGTGKLTLTGHLGEVMRESAHAAMSYLRSRTQALGLPADFHQKNDIHIHIPEGAIPKDGPSAGITMATALASAIAGRAVRRGLCMTGEITLTGRILPVGGIKEKLLAAHRAGVFHVLLPQGNAGDLAELPQSVRRKLTIELVASMDEVLAKGLLSSVDVVEQELAAPLVVDEAQDSAHVPSWMGGEA